MSPRLALHGGTPVRAEPVRFPWPVLTADHEQILVVQARTALSIYDRSGAVASFEDAFGQYQGARYTLATSSGTAALHSLYYGASLGPGDEVICCDYGFFATVTPLVHLGVTPVFVDCLSDGTLDPDAAVAAITPRTRAVVVTHMWGLPGRVDHLRDLCDQHGLLLIEDCSHAHGARLDGQLVGTFGHAAAWSLQAGKTLWAGEGGVLCTELTAVHERALLLGHFNKRALQDIPETSEHHLLARTGTGLKYRAHPLGLALAASQVKGLDDLVAGRQSTAARWIQALLAIPGVQILGDPRETTLHAYYALVCLISPQCCGFDRETFVRALHAENIRCVDRVTQMGSLTDLELFRRASAQSTHLTSHPTETSRRISATAVRFFVPSWAPENRDGILAVEEAIVKVGKDLGP
jgi:perosamine synthetase